LPFSAYTVLKLKIKRDIGSPSLDEYTTDRRPSRMQAAREPRNQEGKRKGTFALAKKLKGKFDTPTTTRGTRTSVIENVEGTKKNKVPTEGHNHEKKG